MKKLLVCILCFITLNAFAVGSKKLDQVGQSLPTTVIDAQWLVVKARYVNGKILICKSNGFLSAESTCVDYTPEAYLKSKIKNTNIEVIGISPFLNEHGEQLGVVIYYK